MSKTDVLVVGAGPTGLTMANLLVRGGVRVRIIEKNARPTSESRALVVHAKTLELLEKFGLSDQAVEEGRKVESVYLLSRGRSAGKIAFSGAKVTTFTPYPFILVFEQSRMERLLLQGLSEAKGQVEWETEMQSLTQTSTGVQVTVRRAGGEVETIEAGWVVGADGAHSSVRHALSLGFTGQTYNQPLFLADVEMEWKLGTQPAFSADLTLQGFNAFIPMPGGPRNFRLFGSLPTEFADRNELTLDELQNIISVSKKLHVNLLSANWISIYRISRRMTERFRVGRVFLIGDAAHIHSPAGGQGMNTGIGDAYNLAWKLALVVRGDAQELLLDSYEAERMPFAHAILNGSDRIFDLQVTHSWLGQQFKIYIVPLLSYILAVQPTLTWQLFKLASQLWTNYRKSPISTMSGSAKKGPKAGDRAPYGIFEEGIDAGYSLFDRLGGLDHHLLFFTGSQPDVTFTASQAKNLQFLVDAYKAPIELHRITSGNRSLHQRYGADEPTIFLVRPDGHIAYRGPAADSDSLRAYLDKLFMRQMRHEQMPATPQGMSLTQ